MYNSPRFTDRPWLAADPVIAPAFPPAGRAVVQTGAWILPDQTALPDEIEHFLAGGPPPIFFGFGSMQASERAGRVLIAAARALGLRSILSRGWADLAPGESGSDCLPIGDVNFARLFPRVAAIVHHGGAGTTMAAACAGRPQVVVPHVYGQFYWANRVQQLGVGVSGPTRDDLTVDALVQALRACLQPEITARPRPWRAALSRTARASPPSDWPKNAGQWQRNKLGRLLRSARLPPPQKLGTACSRGILLFNAPCAIIHRGLPGCQELPGCNQGRRTMSIVGTRAVFAMPRDQGATRQAAARVRLRSWGPPALVLAAGLALAAPMWLAPYLLYGHDSLFHIFNLFALDRQIAAGVFYPLRFPELGFGYGYAVPSYYPPLGYYLLELWHVLGANYVVAYKLGFTLIILVAGLTSYGLAATLFGRAAGVVVSLAYLYNPYFLTDVYTRAALAECLALAVAPLAFLAVHRAGTTPGWRSFILTGPTLALLVLTHPVSTLLYAPFIVAYALLLLLQAAPHQRGRVLAVLMVGGLVAALLAAFYWLPAQLETAGRRLIDPQGAMTSYVSGLQPLARLVRWAWITGLPPDGTLATFSIVAPLLLAMSLIYSWLTRRQQAAAVKARFAFFAASLLAALWFMTPSASGLWRHFSPIIYAQFPFRWFGPLALFAALAIGGSLEAHASGWPHKLYRLGLAALLAFVIVTSVRHVPLTPSTLPADPRTAMLAADVNAAELRAYEYTQADLADWVWVNEYVPSTSSLSDYRRFQHALSLNIPVRSTLPALQARLVPTTVDANRLEAQVASPVPWMLSFHAFWLPGWSAMIDGKPAPAAPVGALGVVGVNVPAGEHSVRLVFGPTPLRLAALVVSLLAFVAWLAVAWRRSRRLAAVVSVVLLVAVGLFASLALRASPAPALQPLDVNFGGKIGLQGFAVGRTADSLSVNLVWWARAPLSASYKVFIELEDDRGRSLARVDGRPQSDASNTNRWAPGLLVPDRFDLPLPPALAPGLYRLRVRLYDEADGQALPVLDAAGQPVAGYVQLTYQEAGSGGVGRRDPAVQPGRASTLAFLARQKPGQLVYSLPAGRAYQGSFRLLALDLYSATARDGKRRLVAELAWESGSYDRPLSLSLRLNSAALPAAAQADQWVLDAQGQAAPRWRGVEQGVTLIDLAADDLPPGEYELSLIPYHSDTLQPLQPDAYGLGTLSLP